MTVHRNAATDYTGQRAAGVKGPGSAENRLELLVGESEPMLGLYRQIRECATTDASVFLIGESGTGKERVARAIHQLSARSDRDFIPLFCGSLSPELLESELFGDEKPGFTVPGRDHPGYLQRAANGTLFLDDITEMNAGLQARLLQVLESQGGAGTGFDTRIIAATSMDPEQAVRRGRLNEGLYRNLAQVRIRDRKSVV